MEKNNIKFIPSMDFAPGTCLQHRDVQLSYNDLKRMFGEPHFEGLNGDKTTTEWSIEYEKREAGEDESQYGVFTVYDWHKCRNIQDDYAKSSWNIGGKTIADYFAFLDAVKVYEDIDNDVTCLEGHEWTS